MIAFALSLAFLAAQREPAPVRAPLPEVLQTLREAPESGAAPAIEFARLQELLDSPIQEFVEGAAFIAGEHQRVECVPALIEALRRDRLGRYGKSSRVGELALDALIRLEISPPAEELFDTRFCTRPEMVFAAVMLEADPDRRCDALARLLEWTADEQKAHWAAAIELVRASDRRVADPLLRQEWRASVTVVGADGASRFSGRFCCARSQSSRNKVWPPHVSYLIDLSDVDDALQSPGIVRGTRTRAFVARPSELSQFLRDRWRLRLLAELAPRSSTLAIGDLSTTTDATDAVRLRSLVEDHRNRIHSHVSSLATNLTALGLLRPSPDLLEQLRIVVDIADRRPDRSQLLLTPDPVPGVRMVVTARAP